MASRVKIIQEMMKNSQRKAISLGTLTALLVAIMIWFALSPTVTAISEVVSKNQKGTEWYNVLRDKNEQLTNLIIERDERQNAIQENLKYFPVDENFSLFISNLDKGATNNGFTLVTVNFDEPNDIDDLEDLLGIKTKNLEPIVFNLNLVGEKDNIPAFFSYLNSLPYIVRTTRVSYNIDENEEETIGMQIIVYKVTDPIFSDEL